ncbi:protein DpdJ [Mycolicibacterium sp. XJ662]
MNLSSEQSLFAALDLIEEVDARHIAWGLTDESWTRPQLVELLAAKWDGSDPDECINELVIARLLVKLPREWPNRYRTRMAEAVRLFTHLRQLFPNRPWQSGSSLVSDYRFLRRPRYFPSRDQSPALVMDALKQRDIPDSVLTQVNRILGHRSISTFQLQATEAVFSSLQSSEDAGIVVGAGTGSGKTLAFYLPALATLAESSPGGPRVIAIYPRNELLKDQLATALGEVRELQGAGGPTLTVGAYFGPTPFRNDRDPDERSGWRKHGDSWICPFLTCPVPNASGDACGGALVWRRAHRAATALDWGDLTCQRCGQRVEADEVRLTRQSMQAQPPDVLFTTTEMLNQSMADGWSRHVFGLGHRATRKPRLVLLDEIHTYVGSSGAQVAFLLRRWRQLLGTPVAWVGLSATLANAAKFFSDLCGVPTERIEDIRPDPADMIHLGSEYQLLLRGDPASQSALLSTSIQSLMLLRRILDKDADLSNTFGSRVFAFLDNLDLVNRLYRQMLSAEGLNPIGRREPNEAVLAGLRLPDYARSHGVDIADESVWDSDGQYWWLPQTLGFGDQPLTISRTSSQDTGVSAKADVVVASSSLEVGYDDARVGGVLQHKAPRDIAQFLQRRGRAGRLQHQRPWTVVVLSDYGRDRLVFQSYESILDPSIPAKHLPLGNQSVRKMQAAMALVDWAAVRLTVDQNSIWNLRTVWSKPLSDQQTVEKSVHLLEEVLEAGPAQQSLIKYVKTSLNLTDDEVHTVCWEHPRSLLLEVVPTMYRRLRSNWATLTGAGLKPGTDATSRQPLPEFIPPTLFGDLELPEVQIEPPVDYDRAAETSVAIAMALNELTPGKVTLRWAVRKVKGLWIEPSSNGEVALEDGLAIEGRVVTQVAGAQGKLPLVRPTVIRPDRQPTHIRPSSNGRLRWQFRADLDALHTDIPRPRSGPLGDLVPCVRAYLSSDLGPLQTWRYATTGSAEVVTNRGREHRDYSFSWHGQPAAVGFGSAVDAVAVTVTLPDSIDAFKLNTDTERLRQLRTDRFFMLMRKRFEQAGISFFTANWVAEVVLSITASTMVRGYSIDDLRKFRSTDWESRGEEVVDAVLLIDDSIDPDDFPLRTTILETLRDPSTTDILTEALKALDDEPDKDWLDWVRQRFLQTMAAAWQYAAQQACPDLDADLDVLVDIVEDSGDQAEIIISDVSSGGGNLVESLARRIAEDPRRFDRLIAGALESSESEEVDVALRHTLRLLHESAGVADAAVRFRNARNDRLGEWRELVARLADEGVPRAHSNLAAMSLRVFRAGSTPQTDDLIRLILAKWDDIDRHAGFAVDHRTAAVLLASDSEVSDTIRQVNGSAQAEMSLAAVQSVIQSLLWARASARRPEALRVGNRFVDNPPLTERTLVRDVLPSTEATVNVDIPDWRDPLVEALKATGSATLVTESANVAVLAGAIRELIVQPIDFDWLLIHPQVESITRDNGRFSAVVTSGETPQ